MSDVMTWADIEAAAIKRWHHKTAYRCGIIAGEKGANVTPPSGKSPRWYRHYREGVELGGKPLTITDE